MKKILLLSAGLIISCTLLHAQTNCGNLDFEDTTFFNWTGATGLTPGGSFLLPNTSWVNGIITTGPNASVNDYSNRMTVITQNYIDSNTVDPATGQLDTLMTTLAPNGGGVSVRLGNTNVGNECERIRFSFPVQLMRNFMFQFATVMEDPGHNWDGQPYFMFNVFDQSGNIIPSLSDTIWSADTLYPFISTTSPTGHILQYRRWTPVALDLSPWVSQTITIEFMNSDCAYGGHFGYTYLDVACISNPITGVWPGDCDYDLMANNYDILPLGIAFGANGMARPGGNNSWTGQPSNDWPQSFAFNMNYKHSDCNGDGTIDLDDTLAIVQNYGQNHPFRVGGFVADPQTNVNFPPLYLVPVQPTIGPANYVDVDVYAGNANYPVDRLYGVSWMVNYDNVLIQPGTFSWDFSGSGMGIKNTSMITITNQSTAQDQEAGMCRISGSELNGTIYLGRMHFAVQNVSVLSTLHLNVRDIKAVDMNMVEIPLTPVGCDITIDPQLPASVNVNTNEVHVNLFPNPASDVVEVSASVPVTTIGITDAAGRLVRSVNANAQLTSIDVSDLSAGMYFVNVYSANGRSVLKLEIR